MDHHVSVGFGRLANTAARGGPATETQRNINNGPELFLKKSARPGARRQLTFVVGNIANSIGLGLGPVDDENRVRCCKSYASLQNVIRWC